MDDALSVSGFLDVGDGHQLYWEDWGNPRGAPVLFLHGGPGDSFRDAHKALFDPQAHRVLFFDQRGCGRSRPFACTEHNTTPRLLDDIDRLLDHVGMPSAHVAGGSWGSALALLYAISSPDRVRSLVVWGVYLIRGFDNDWVNEGYPRHHFPVEWDRFISLVPERARRDGNAVMRFYAQQMRIDDATDGVDAATYALEWTLWESTLASIAYEPTTLEADLRNDPATLSKALLETHYFLNGCFVPEDFILANLGRIGKIPCQIVQGRFDMCTPAVSAHDLRLAYGANASLRWVNAGHLPTDPELSHAIRAATASFS